VLPRRPAHPATPVSPAGPRSSLSAMKKKRKIESDYLLRNHHHIHQRLITFSRLGWQLDETRKYSNVASSLFGPSSFYSTALLCAVASILPSNSSCHFCGISSFLLGCH
jgi:hypothetical protein